MNIPAKYLIDEKGEKKSVVVGIDDYLRLMEYLENLEDSLDLKNAQKNAKKFIDFKEFKTKLKKAKKI